MHVFAPLSAVKAGANRKKPIPRSRSNSHILDRIENGGLSSTVQPSG